ncbi:IclR family transcriptional regulator [Microbacterium fluvii]|uniref:IclR family transcriptional regulator n=1 Tax=Microbacterium fluvii TaxID=415215 RepID=A0ABW2HDR2_9MICO|nr:helix-turn-helix domain-containing protein [Microbacterium fluvii]MCU4673090.1 helix-turn-helix domain-containing protein [Microbacterium fluvii]
MRTAGWTEQVTVLDRVTAVLDAFDAGDDGIGVSELARRANLPKSTVSRIAADLVAEGLLERDEGRLYVGARLHDLGRAVDLPRRLRAAALPVMTELRDATGETVRLTVADDVERVVIAVARGRVETARTPAVGSRIAGGAPAVGSAVPARSGAEIARLEIAAEADRSDFHPDRLAPLVRRAAAMIGQRLRAPRT